MLPFTMFSWPQCSRHDVKIYEVQFTLIRFCCLPPGFFDVKGFLKLLCAYNLDSNSFGKMKKNIKAGADAINISNSGLLNPKKLGNFKNQML